MCLALQRFFSFASAAVGLAHTASRMRWIRALHGALEEHKDGFMYSYTLLLLVRSVFPAFLHQSKQ